MGKFSLLLSLSVVGAVTILAFQGNQTSVDTRERQSLRQGKVIARQIARSGYNSVLSEAHEADGPDKEVGQVVSAVDTVQGEYEGGTYKAWLKKISSSAYTAVSVSRFSVADSLVEYRIGGYANNTMKAPTVETPSQLNVTFEQSMAGYCSAVYLKRVKPGTKPKNQPDPEMVFPPGNDRNDAASSYEKTIESGTRLNFILAVDKNCSHEGDESADFPGDYDHIQRSFKQDVDKLNTMREAPYGMVEETTIGSSDGWRVSFEDQRVFSEAQLWDIKENGYPDNSYWSRSRKTYGGNGWRTTPDGLRDLDDYGDIPDFSDQVFKVALTDPNSGST
ncbi:hypothetical protein GGP80_002300 [Salinibacter ruber]|jgi:hypothetical protein|uniref:hypothetical protein n=2 Tax=Salinibacter ruber TaxID=146919 RepID=UPI000E57AA54|nr:hypothetical protein [Salinibacter ruber]MBB4060652.1 hypothetical protein [Salinibacter ruber]MBB4068690.1 hypothetical protein [Salinibacter ruber]MCS3636774.1 hypothetical protein [Salinibacter ruber]MCS3672550.1 hypothetical protein [Salinibacter ruber]MCS3707578.1 hypothetical protein [Salinibacter ruber]